MSRPNKFKEKYLENNGIDAEEVKAEYGYGSEVDIYNGDTVTFRNKDGSLAEDTGMSKDEFFKNYGKNKEEERWVTSIIFRCICSLQKIAMSTN